MSTTPTPGPITRQDLESSLRGIESSVKGEVEDRKKTAITWGVIGAIGLALVIFFFGRRAGKKKSTVVEIRRI